MNFKLIQIHFSTNNSVYNSNSKPYQSSVLRCIQDAFIKKIWFVDQSQNPNWSIIWYIINAFMNRPVYPFYPESNFQWLHVDRYGLTLKTIQRFHFLEEICCQEIRFQFDLMNLRLFKLAILPTYPERFCLLINHSPSFLEASANRIHIQVAAIWFHNYRL